MAKRRTVITGSGGFVGDHLRRYVSSDLPVIFNLASISSVEQSIAEPAYVISNNIECMLDALDEARQTGKTFIHLSSVEAAHPTNPYAASKAAQEAIALSYFRTYGVPVIIARSNNIVGEGQSSEKFIPKLIKQIKAGETVQIYEGGSRVYNPVFNVADALIHLTHGGELGKTYLIGGGTRLTNLQMAKRIADKLGKPLEYELVKGRPGYKRTLRGEGEKIPGWEPFYTLQDGLGWIH